MLVRPITQYVDSEFAEGRAQTQIRRIPMQANHFPFILNRCTTEAFNVTHCYFSVSC